LLLKNAKYIKLLTQVSLSCLALFRQHYLVEQIIFSNFLLRFVWLLLCFCRSTNAESAVGPKAY
jgi:hypothetical protein